MSDVASALRSLVEKLDEIHNDPLYKSVWTSYVIHGGHYKGPNYIKELADARLALDSLGLKDE